ncbi:MAG: hypothetical protein JF616_20680 [Fibrobacteres bacterium]|nr:hypothetical protein [Fibrobacterota bacterium]
MADDSAAKALTLVCTITGGAGTCDVKTESETIHFPKSGSQDCAVAGGAYRWPVVAAVPGKGKVVIEVRRGDEVLDSSEFTSDPGSGWLDFEI